MLIHGQGWEGPGCSFTGGDGKDPDAHSRAEMGRTRMLIHGQGWEGPGCSSRVVQRRFHSPTDLAQPVTETRLELTASYV
jgi:hypothetical protein